VRMKYFYNTAYAHYTVFLRYSEAYITYVFTIYIKIFRGGQIIWRGMVEWLAANEFERMWKEVVVV
jgi:hypothetical protein